MPENDDIGAKLTIVTAEEIVGMRRAGGLLTKKLDIDPDQLSININIFLKQMAEVVNKTPKDMGPFQLSEIEVSAEITGKGQVVLWGVGGEVGAGGGVKFVFKKAAVE